MSSIQCISLLLVLLAAAAPAVLSYDRSSSSRGRDGWQRPQPWGHSEDAAGGRRRPEGDSGDRRQDRADRYTSRYEGRHWQRRPAIDPAAVTRAPSTYSPTEQAVKMTAITLPPASGTDRPQPRPTAAGSSRAPADRRQRPDSYREHLSPDGAPKNRSSASKQADTATEDPIRGAADHDIDPQQARLDTQPFEELKENRTVTRQGKFLSLLTLVRFTNFVCNATSGSNGTCYTASECSQLGGVSEGDCASGYGVCCVLMKTCGETTNTNNTYFVNQDYPSSYSGTGSCQLQVTKVNSNICQLRLDFDIFDIAQPETSNNLCLSDQFVVDAASPVPSICGTNTGNHMYIDTGVQGTESPITLSVVTSGTSISRSWKIRVSQIPCNELYTAEPGCLQYHTGVSGKLRSFNFGFTTGLQLSNQDYAMCVRMERNFCGIQYQPCTDSDNSNTNSFSLGGSTTNTVNAVTGAACTADWLIIPCATDNVNTPLTTMSDNNVCVDRLCGDVFNTVSGSTTSAAVYTFTKPFRLFYHTDSQEASSTPAEGSNRGFCLDYVQQPCTS